MASFFVCVLVMSDIRSAGFVVILSTQSKCLIVVSLGLANGTTTDY
jgi:hypothetical protein